MCDKFNGLSSESVQALLDWFVLGRQGISSKTIARAILGKDKTSEDCHPLDVGDFKRCQALIESHPELEAAFKRVMPERSVYWKHLCRVWDSVQYYIDHGKDEEAYAIMNFAKGNAAKELKETQ